MVELGLEVDWEHFLDDIPENLDLFDYDVLPDATTATADNNDLSWMGELEELLMKDDDDDDNCNNVIGEGEGELSNGFQVSDLLLDFEGAEVVDFAVGGEGEEEKRSPASSVSVGNDPAVVSVGQDGSEKGGSPNFESNGENDKSDDALEVNEDDSDDHADDPLSKKRKRQLRNKDAAMRSRERKKMYVKDLEMKSQYLEAECRRLGRLLQCCYAENQMLRVSLHSSSAFAAPMTKPESAVLSLESLLLVSLVWFMVNICLLPLPKLPLSDQEAALLASGDKKDLGSAALRGKGLKTSELWLALSFTRSKRCRASRPKMKSRFDRNVLCF